MEPRRPTEASEVLPEPSLFKALRTLLAASLVMSARLLLVRGIRRLPHCHLTRHVGVLQGQSFQNQTR